MTFWTRLLDTLKHWVNQSAIALSLAALIFVGSVGLSQQAQAAIGGSILYTNPRLSQQQRETLHQRLLSAIQNNPELIADGISPFLDAKALPALHFKQPVLETPPEPAETLEWNFWEPVKDTLLNQSGLFEEAPLAWPMSRYKLSSGFGWRWGRRHNGLDLTAPVGTTVNTAATGIVVFSGFSQGYGRMIVIEHGNGMKTRYAHLSRSFVNVGDFVFSRQMIGAVGMTGQTTGPHLHFEVLVNNQFVDPKNYLA